MSSSVTLFAKTETFKSLATVERLTVKGIHFTFGFTAATRSSMFDVQLMGIRDCTSTLELDNESHMICVKNKITGLFM